MSEDGIDGWEAHKRQDGALVLVTELGNWIATVEGRPALTTCPCCDKPFATARAAKRVCDALYPMATA